MPVSVLKWLGVVAAVGAGLYGIWWSAFPSVTLRYRLTLGAQVDGHPAVGSGVIQVTTAKNPQFLGASAQISHAVRGEAVMVDLGARGLLFALLKQGDHSRSGAEYIVPMAWGFRGGVGPENFPWLRSVHGRVTLPFDRLPLLVRFRDINDPTTVDRVDPNDLAMSFGPGVTLTSATIDIVDAGLWPLNLVGITGTPVTTGIEKRLEWLPSRRRGIGYLGSSAGDPTNDRTKLYLNGSEFSIGVLHQ